MSVASDFAVALAAAIATRSAVPIPASWSNDPTGVPLNATVTEDGGCIVDRSATLTRDQALALGNWLLSTFT